MSKNEQVFKSDEAMKIYMDAYAMSLELWNVDYESIYVETSFGSTHVLLAGPKTGRPLVLLHGFGFSSTMWYPNIESLSKEYRVYAIDVIGEFNRSKGNKSFSTRHDYSVWLSEVLDELKVSKAILMGHSNGGWHALNYASSNNDRVDGLVLLAPAASFTSFSLQFPFRLILANIVRTKGIIINFFARWFVSKGNFVEDRLFEQFYLGLIHFGWKYKIIRPSVFKKEDLQNIDCPVLFVVGDKEVIYNHLTAIKKAKQYLPQVETVIIENAGHAISIERSEKVNNIIINFLEKCFPIGSNEKKAE
ncbi:alpha/beta fold hydrolase [Fredinandcohnia humi]